MRLLLDMHIFLICQALEHGLTLVTTAPVVLRYPVPVPAG